MQPHCSPGNMNPACSTATAGYCFKSEYSHAKHSALDPYFFAELNQAKEAQTTWHCTACEMLVRY
uniref:Uncharacterized protein n=1 Tax=Anguilla anguilla TaxID=7936 RepID=A0A0E9UTQ3_ANGAN